jgi:hypothetical protein
MFAFDYEYPLFAIVRKFTTDPQQPNNVSFHDILTLSAPDNPNAPNAIALFTDRPGAEQFRDENAPEYQIFEIPDSNVRNIVLNAAKKVAILAALDPYRLGKGVRTIYIDEFIRQ